MPITVFMWSSDDSLPGGESPLDHMNTVTGMQEAKTMLYHIEYGMPA